MRINKHKLLRIKKSVPWVLLVVATLFTNTALLIYASTDQLKANSVKDVLFLNVDLPTLKIPKVLDKSIIALTTAEEKTGEKKKLNVFYNKDYYNLLQRTENYKSLFEDLYHIHLQINLSNKLGIKAIGAAETAAMLDAGYNSSTPRKKVVAAKVKGLENLFFNDLFLRRSIQKVKGIPTFTKKFEKFLDLYFDLFRPVKTYQIFVPFIKPLYYTPDNYPLKNGEKVIPIYEGNNSFQPSDLFSSKVITKLSKFLLNLNSLDNYIDDFNSKNEKNKIENKRQLMMSFYDKYSAMIDSVVGEDDIGIGVVDIEKRFRGESYVTLSSNTFDQRLKSYSGSIVPSYTNQSLSNSYLAFDGIEMKNSQLSIGNQVSTNPDIHQILRPIYKNGDNDEQNVSVFLNQMTVSPTVNGVKMRRLSNSFFLLPISSTKLGNDVIIVSSSNYGLHFSLPKKLYSSLNQANLSMRKLFKENLKEDLLTCNLEDGSELKCDNARESLVEAMRALKYSPLLLTNIFDSINILDSKVYEYIKSYQNYVNKSYSNYGMDIFKQLLSFTTFEVSAGSDVPINFNFAKFRNNQRWK